MTLLELMIVVIIVGIMATLAVNAFFGPTETAREREAQANLKLIASAEKIYRLENGQYIALADAARINQMLRLMIPVDGRHWTYNVTVGGTNNSTFKATGVRAAGRESGKRYMINETLDEPVRMP